ncbi:hypothetical protein Zmor_011230 [Zophobas morio]|uniref:Uncharacterized protein n=1 Tax=Zophobas morio TaxID=2755281 RepID=A0AA38ISU9_9CUCU|nr:hypothetical protein Zmor_011230 [Zophobas morio]
MNIASHASDLTRDNKSGPTLADICVTAAGPSPNSSYQYKYTQYIRITAATHVNVTYSAGSAESKYNSSLVEHVLTSSPRNEL